MHYSIYITPTALDDLQEGFDFYNNRIANLGFRFGDEVDNALEAVAKNPTRYPFRYQNVRAKIVAKFPYLIFYTINVFFILLMRPISLLRYSVFLILTRLLFG